MEEHSEKVKALQGCYMLHGRTTSSRVLEDASSVCKREVNKARRGNSLEDKRGKLCSLTNLLTSTQNDCSSTETLTLQAFDVVWQKIELIIKGALARLHTHIFKKLQQWVYDIKFHDAQLNLYYATIGKASKIGKCNSSRRWSKQSQAIGISSNRIHTALLLFGAVDFSDSRAIFDGLITYFKDHNCHVASLQSHILSSKAVVGSALQSIFKQLTQQTIDTMDVETLAAWHMENPNKDNPIVIIIEDVECCNSALLAELVAVLSEWVPRVPLVLLIGMSTTCSSLKKLLPSKALSCLRMQRFSLMSPVDHLEATFKAFLMDSGIFSLGHDVVEFLFKFFFTHDHNISSVLKSLKIACMEHFCKEPLSFLCKDILQCSYQDEFENCCINLSKTLLNYAENMGSLNRVERQQNVGKWLADALWKVKMRRQMWAISLLCLYKAGMHFGFGFADIYCEVLRCRNSSNVLSTTGEESLVESVILRIRDLPSTIFCTILEEWKQLASCHQELSSEMSSLQFEMAKLRNFQVQENNVKDDGSHKFDGNSGRSVTSEPEERQTLIRQCGYKSELSHVKSMAIDLLERLCRQYLIPPETLPFHEVFCFSNVNLLKKALTADTRKQIQADVLSPYDYLNCTCCLPEHGFSSSMHDTALLYSLSKGSGDMINIYDWYQSFYMHLSEAQCSDKSPGKNSSKRKRSISKKVPDMHQQDLQLDKATIQARFTRAITELQIVGLLRLPTKKRPDYVQRIVSL